MATPSAASGPSSGMPSGAPLGGNGAPTRAARPGVGSENMLGVFAMHRHAGGPADGQSLYGPYFIVDSITKRTYQILAVDGQLMLQLVK